MALASLLKNLASSAIKAAGDTVVSVTYTTYVTGTYDPATDTIASTETVHTFDAVPTFIADNEYDYAKVNDIHLKIIVAANDITFVPAGEDHCVIRGAKYEVKRIKGVPGDAIYILYLQQV